MVIMSDAGAFSLRFSCALLAVLCGVFAALWLSAESRGPEYIQLPGETVTVTDTVTVRDTVTLWRAPQPQAQGDTSAQEGPLE